MLQSKMTSRGQITIPLELRKKLNIKSGDMIRFTAVDGNMITINPVNQPASKLKGFLPKPNFTVSLEEMDEAIAIEASKSCKIWTPEQTKHWTLLGKTAEENSDLPIEFIRDILTALKEKSTPFTFVQD